MVVLTMSVVFASPRVQLMSTDSGMSPVIAYSTTPSDQKPAVTCPAVVIKLNVVDFVLVEVTSVLSSPVEELTDANSLFGNRMPESRSS